MTEKLLYTNITQMEPLLHSTADSSRADLAIEVIHCSTALSTSLHHLQDWQLPIKK